MSWEHFTATSRGSVTVTDLGSRRRSPAEYALGTVATGKARSFHGYRLTIEHGAKTYVGDSRYSLREAIVDCARKLNAANLSISVASLSESFKETGLSENSGYGYWDDRKDPVHMMAEV